MAIKTLSSVNKILSAILIIAILGAIGALGYVIATPRSGEGFTEFYILGLERKAENYPKELVVGQEGKVIVGIINREHKTASYRVEVRISGVKNNESGPVFIAYNGKWQEVLSFTSDKVGDNQTVEFLLYKDGESTPYLKPLYLSVNIKGK